MVDILWLTYSIWIPHPQPMEIGYSIIISNGMFLLNSYCWHCFVLFCFVFKHYWSTQLLDPLPFSLVPDIPLSWFSFCISDHSFLVSLLCFQASLSPKWGNFTSLQQWIFASMSLIHASMFPSNPVASDAATACQCLSDQTLPTLTFQLVLKMLAHGHPPQG